MGISALSAASAQAIPQGHEEQGRLAGDEEDSQTSDGPTNEVMGHKPIGPLRPRLPPLPKNLHFKPSALRFPVQEEPCQTFNIPFRLL